MTYFEFEQDFVSSLRCIPMAVRWRLDTCGIKLKLTEWQLFSLTDRQNLAAFPFADKQAIADYREYLQNLIFQLTGVYGTALDIDPHPPWSDATVIPSSLTEKLRTAGRQISLDQWQKLSPLQRFALVKLSRSSHEQRNFIPALREFGCID